MGESQDSFLTQEAMTDKDVQKRCCQWNRKSMTITITVCIASVLILVALIIRFHSNVRPDEKYASIGTIPFPAITICPGIRSGYPNKNNFNRTLFLMQTEAAPKLRPRKYEGHSCVSVCFFFQSRETLLCYTMLAHTPLLHAMHATCMHTRACEYILSDLDFLFFLFFPFFLPSFFLFVCFCCCGFGSFVWQLGKLHWKHYFNCATGTSFGVYGIGIFWNVMWMKRIKWKHSIKLPAILMKMQKFARGIDAPHAMNIFDQLSPMKADAIHL